jgi:MFS family permease
MDRVFGPGKKNLLLSFAAILALRSKYKISLNSIQLGAIMSGPLTGLAVEQLGRQRAMIFLTFPFFFGWLSIYSAQFLGLWMMYIGRFITGTNTKQSKF